MPRDDVIKSTRFLMRPPVIIPPCPHHSVYCIINIKLFMEFLYLIFLYFPKASVDLETNPGPRMPVTTVCRLLCSNVRGLAGNLSDLTVASSQYDILLCSESLVPDMHHVSELLVPGFGRTVLLCWGRMPGEMLVSGFVLQDRTYLCSVFTETLT